MTRIDESLEPTPIAEEGERDRKCQYRPFAIPPTSTTSWSVHVHLPPTSSSFPTLDTWLQAQVATASSC
jgi:hypothetical protein